MSLSWVSLLGGEFEEPFLLRTAARQGFSQDMLHSRFIAVAVFNQFQRTGLASAAVRLFCDGWLAPGIAHSVNLRYV